ncbi:hypothetical protein R4J01_04790 [Brachyspira pilosicoli]|uniref:hypothetical protein n=1 Tax=Brachyspira pilosicoli TaxID=52584 RepID=UPI003006F43F
MSKSDSFDYLGLCVENMFFILQGFALNEVHSVQHPTSFATEGSAGGVPQRTKKALF